MKNKNISIYFTAIFLVIILFVINIISSKIYFKIDTTEEKLYTLSKHSKKILKKLDDEITIKYFFSFSNESLPIVVKNYGKRVKEFLEEYASVTPFINLETYNPIPDSDEELEALKYNIKKISVSNSSPFYIGAVAIHKDSTFAIGFFDMGNEASLELEISNMIVQVRKSKEKNVLGIISSLPLKDIEQINQNWTFIKDIEKAFIIKILEEDVEEIPTDISMLMLLHPFEMIEETEYAIDQYILKGGKLAILIDPSARTLSDIKQAKEMKSPVPIATSSNLDYVFKTIGMKYDKNKVVADIDSATQVFAKDGILIRYPFWISAKDGNFNKDNFISKSFKSMMLIECGYFEKIEKNDFKYNSLINTKGDSGVINSMELNFMQLGDAEKFKRENKQYSIAGIVSGKFKSAFKKKPEASLYSKKHTKEAKVMNSVLLIGDIDFLNNRYSLKVTNFYGNKVFKKTNQNFDFLTNCLEFLSGDTNLIAIRSKGQYLRPFDKVAELEKKAQTKWLALEKELTQKIYNLQKELNKLQAQKKDSEKKTFSLEQQAKVIEFKEKEIILKKERREIRKKLRHDIKFLGNVLSITNIAFIPIVILIFGIYIYNRRKQGKKIFKKR